MLFLHKACLLQIYFSHKSLNVKQETIEKQFEEAVRKVNITSEHKKAIVRALKESHIEEEKFHQEQIKIYS